MKVADEDAIEEERHSCLGNFEPLSLNNDFRWASLHVYDIAPIFDLHFQSPKTCSKSWKSHFVLLRWLLLLRPVSVPLPADQQLSKLLTGLNEFIEIFYT